MSAFTKGSWAWQKFGKEYCLTGQYGHRPIILSATPKGQLRTLDKGLLVPLSPEHPDADLIASAPDLYEALFQIEKWSCQLEDEKQDGDVRLINEIARKALAKARGEL